MNDLEELKTLLFGAEKRALDSITDRVQKPETRAVDVADVLPEAIRLSHREGGELVDTLREPVGECLHDSFHNEPERYADALYPVMGPAIRKSILNALRAFAQQISETIEQSLTPRGIRWRFDAWRAGVPFGEYVVQRTLLYRIEQAYLISRDNGLLIGHVHHQASRIKDSDAVSAMFTAIQDFIKESFSPDRSGRLETADMGEFTLWAVHGPHALLVCVIRGVPPRLLRGDLSAILERIHFRYGDGIRDYSGDTSTMAGVEEELANCLQFEATQPADEKKRRSFLPLVVVTLLIVGLMAWFGYRNWEARQEVLALQGVIDNTPGWYVSDIDRTGSELVVRGLRDPLAASIEDVASAAGLSTDRLVADLRPFQSLDPEIVYQRTLAALDVPSSASVTVDADRLVVSGSASQVWIDAAEQKVATGAFGMPVELDGVSSADLEQLRADVAAAREVRFAFTDGTELSDADASALRDHVTRVSSLVREAERLGATLSIAIIGEADAIGTVEFNTDLAARRASLAEQMLIEQGVSATRLSTSLIVDSDVANAPKLDLRRVSILLELDSPSPAIEADPE